MGYIGFRFLFWLKNINEPQYDKTNKMTVRPAKTQISQSCAYAQSDQSLRCALNSLNVFYCNFNMQLGWATSSLNISYGPPHTEQT